MSVDIGIHKSLRKARGFVSAQKGELAPLALSEEEINPEIQNDLSLQVYNLEPATSCYRVPYQYPEDADSTEFAFFEDGRQKTVQIGHIPIQYNNHFVIIPVHYFIVAAVILCRDQRRLKLWDVPQIREGILVERSLIPDQRVLSEFEESGLLIVDTEAQGADYYELRKRALRKATMQRRLLEDDLVDKWGHSKESQDHFLIVDGTLMNLRTEQNVDRCIGVSKSFGTRYFSVSEHNRIMRMSEFERSWTFRFHSPEDENDDLRKGPRERVSWYLRLRKQLHSDPEFGLVRIEMSKTYADAASDYANRFSRSLISERFPTSYPKPRWDKHLYPIHECENYLSSIIPSIETIQACMKG